MLTESLKIFGMTLEQSMARLMNCLLVCIVSLGNSIPQALGDVSKQNAKCHFSTYSLEKRDADGEDGFPDAIAYIATTSARFLKLVSPETQLVPANSTDADVKITYILNNYTYRTPFKTDNKTVFDLLGDLPAADADAQTLSSPWLQLSLIPECKLTAVLIWNKRQIVADQAFLAGVRPITKGIVTPVKDPNRFLPKEFEQSVIFLGDYSKAVPGGKAVQRPSAALDEQQEIVKRFVSPKYPPDLFWFFSLIKSSKLHVDEGTFISQLIRNERQLSRHANNVQAELVIALASRFIAESSQHLKYDSILDVDSLVDLDKYRNEEIKRIRY
jgi:hypothetical protein